MVVACSHAGDDSVETRTSGTRQAFPLDDDHSPAFAEDHPVSFRIEGAGGFVSGSSLSGQPVKCAQRGEFQKMQVSEIFFTSSDDGGIDDTIPDHLDGAVKCDQRGRAGCADMVAWPHKPVPVADEAGCCAAESAQECG